MQSSMDWGGPRSSISGVAGEPLYSSANCTSKKATMAGVKSAPRGALPVSFAQTKFIHIDIGENL